MLPGLCRCVTMRFQIPATHESLSISETDLQKAPESLLAVAAQQPHEGDCIVLTEWQDPSFATLKVVAGCYTNQRPALFPHQFPEAMRALDYFAVPQALWPLAILTQAAVKEAHTKTFTVAERLLNTVMDQLLEVGHLRPGQVSKSFAICKADDGSLTAKFCDLRDLEAGFGRASVHIDCALGTAMQRIAQLHHITLQFDDDRIFGDGVFEARTVLLGVL